MEEKKYITIRVYDAVNDIYYDKQVPYVPQPLDKSTKYAELEQFTLALQNKGVEFNGVFYKCDEEAQMNLLKTIALNVYPVIWYSRDGYDSFIVMNTQEEFDAFKNVIAGKMKEIEYQYYQYKFAIDNATTQEELDLITFEEIVPEVVE